MYSLRNVDNHCLHNRFSDNGRQMATETKYRIIKLFNNKNLISNSVDITHNE